MATRSRTRSSRSTSKPSRRGGKRRKSFEYQDRSREESEQSNQESSGQFDSIHRDNIPRYKPQDGRNQVRLLPPTFDRSKFAPAVADTSKNFALTLLVHYGVGPNEQTYLCRKMLGDDEDCAICDEARRLTRDGDAEDANQFKAKKRKAAWIIDRKGETKDPTFWSMPFGPYKSAVSVSKDEDGEWMKVDHPDIGQDLLFEKSGSGLKTEYSGEQFGKQKPIFQDERRVDEVLQYITDNPLDEVLVFYDNEYLQAQLEGKASSSDDDEDEDEDEDERPRRRKTAAKKPRKRSRRDEEDEDEDEDEDLDDEDDEDLDDEDEDDGDEDYDEDDEDEDEDEDEEDEEDDEQDEDEEEDEGDEEDEEEEKPRRKSNQSSLRAAARKARSKTTAKKPARRRSRR